MRFNQREWVETESGAISTGTAQGYGGHDFNSKYGSQHQWSIVANGKSIYFTDAAEGKQLRFGQDGMNPYSDEYGQHNFISNKTQKYWKRPQATWDENENYFDSPLFYGGIISVYDYKNEALITTFTAPATKPQVAGFAKWIDTDPDTIEYSEAANHYKTHHPFTPLWYFNFKKSYLSQNGNNLHVHDEGKKGEIYGAYVKSKLHIVINPALNEEKVFDNAFVDVNPDGAPMFLNLAMRTESQNQSIVFAADDRAVYRDNSLVFPVMQKSQRDRLRGKYLILEYEFQNGNDKTLRLTAQTTEFRISNVSPK